MPISSCSCTGTTTTIRTVIKRTLPKSSSQNTGTVLPEPFISNGSANIPSLQIWKEMKSISDYVLKFQKKILDTILALNLIEPGEGVVAGVSGGPDSVCLIHVL